MISARREYRKWTKDEDEYLMQSESKRAGDETWETIGKRIGRTGRQCRERYEFHLAHGQDGKHEKWDEMDDKLIVLGVEKVGRKWETIRRLFPSRFASRTSLDIKNRWHRSIKERFSSNDFGVTLILEQRPRGRPRDPERKPVPMYYTPHVQDSRPLAVRGADIVRPPAYAPPGLYAMSRTPPRCDVVAGQETVALTAARITPPAGERQRCFLDRRQLMDCMIGTTDGAATKLQGTCEMGDLGHLSAAPNVGKGGVGGYHRNRYR